MNIEDLTTISSLSLKQEKRIKRASCDAEKMRRFYLRANAICEVRYEK